MMSRPIRAAFVLLDTIPGLSIGGGSKDTLTTPREAQKTQVGTLRADVSNWQRCRVIRPFGSIIFHRRRGNCK
jgi:hypothetical protein